jgi:hypothetical protein
MGVKTYLTELCNSRAVHFTFLGSIALHTGIWQFLPDSQSMFCGTKMDVSSDCLESYRDLRGIS